MDKQICSIAGVALSFSLLASCSGTLSGSDATNSDYKSKGSQTDAKSSANLSAAKDEPLVVFQRSSDAFGSASAYTLSIFADGRILYKPIKTERMPVFGGTSTPQNLTPVETTISHDKLQQLLAEFDRINFVELRDQYATRDDGCPSEISDQPGATITFNGAKQQKTIHHSFGCVQASDYKTLYPPDLSHLELTLEDLVPKQP
jgi:hypothetical protein